MQQLKVNSAATTNDVERYKNGTAMALDADTPTGLPTEHHMAIDTTAT